MHVEGSYDSRFEAVRDAFVDNFRREGEVGAAVAVVMGGIRVVDLWGGIADSETGEQWREDTLCGFYSTGKPLAALGLLRLIDSGRLGLDDRVASVWPQFAANGKGAVTLRQVLCHQAGLPAMRRRLPEGAMFDFDLIVGELAAESPWWEPGTKHVYHTNTYGHLVGEPVRRATGKHPSTYVVEELAGPLGEEVYFGVPDHALGRVARLIWESPPPPALPEKIDGMSAEEQMLRLAVTNPPGFSSQGVLNTREWRQATVPSTNGHGTARGIASIYGALARGGSHREVTLLSNAMLGEATSVQSEGYCPALDREVSFGLGFQLTRPDRPMGPNPGAYGHFGTGGSLGFADPTAELGFGYVMNRIKPRWQNPRNKALIAALYSCL